MLYTVEQIFLQGVSFDIAYNELAPENMKNLKKYFSTQSSEKDATVLLAETNRVVIIVRCY